MGERKVVEEGTPGREGRQEVKSSFVAAAVGGWWVWLVD